MAALCCLNKQRQWKHEAISAASRLVARSELLYAAITVAVRIILTSTSTAVSGVGAVIGAVLYRDAT